MTDFTEPMIDIGANLTNRQFQRDLPAVLRRAEAAGLETIVLTGTSMRANRDAVELVRRHQAQTPVKLVTTVGVHPHDAKDFDENATLREMRKLITQNPGTVVAVGECGLDFNRDFSPRDKQERVFHRQVELACELQLPLFLHERDAHETFVSVLRPFVDSGQLPPVVVHCFTGNQRDMQVYLNMGFYIGLTGYVCMESRGFKLRTFASNIPLERLLIETDAPFMYPYGNNTRARCEPKDLRAVVHTLASCYRRTPGEIAAASTANARRFFSLARIDALRRSKQTPTQETKPESSPALASAPPAIKLDKEGAKTLDGGNGEGGGQVIRISTALAATLKKKIHVENIRAGRKVPGLRNQHVKTVQLAEKLSKSALEGAQLGSAEIVFDGRDGSLDGGAFQAVSETGGSVSLMIQGSLPAMLFSKHACTLDLTGGTHVGFSPPVDFIQGPLRTLLGRMGACIDLTIRQHGFFPGGRGAVDFVTSPLTSPLAPIDVVEFSQEIAKISIKVTLHGASVNEELAQTYVASLKRAILKRLPVTKSLPISEEIAVVVRAASGRGRSQRHGRHQHRSEKTRPEVSALVVVETASGGLITVDRTEKDTPDYATSKIMDKLMALFDNEVCVDEHLADNAIVFMALAAGTSRLRVPAKARRTSQHLETALHVVHELTGATFELVENDKNAVVVVHGIGHSP